MKASLTEQLLGDIRNILTEKAVDRISSKDLTEALGTVEGRPWSQKPLTPTKLAKMLRPSGIAPRNIWTGKTALKGYFAHLFVSAFTRHGLKPLDRGEAPSPKPLNRKRTLADLQALAQAHTVRGIQALASIMLAGKSDRVRLRAAKLLLDYGWGKPRAPRRTPAAQEGKGQVRVVVRHA